VTKEIVFPCGTRVGNGCKDGASSYRGWSAKAQVMGVGDMGAKAESGRRVLGRQLSGP
jgi:hypothetical protein